MSYFHGIELVPVVAYVANHRVFVFYNTSQSVTKCVTSKYRISFILHGFTVKLYFQYSLILKRREYLSVYLLVQKLVSQSC